MFKLLMRFTGGNIAGLSGTTCHLDRGVVFKKHCRLEGDPSHPMYGVGVPYGIFVLMH